jgi:hypothetical protein
MATASGHGIGKSTLVAWIVNWILTTRPLCQGTVTANTYQQLETKTWAAIAGNPIRSASIAPQLSSSS